MSHFLCTFAPFNSNLIMLAKETKVYRDTVLFIDELMKVTINFKREYRRTLAERLENKSLELIDYIVLANSSIEYRATYLQQFTVCFEQVNALLDLAVRRRQVSLKQEANLARMMEGIGKQITGWKKSAGVRQSQGAP
jgi:hypothetical protein